MIETATVAIKRFRIRRESTPSMHYRITVEDGTGRVLDKFESPTMLEAERDFEQAGYETALVFSRQLIVAIPRGIR